jgi:hypothetical protein
MGIDGSKYGLMAIMTSVTTVAFITISIVYFLDSYHYLD